MKHLLLIRHAKSKWDNANLADFERPLSETGIRDAKIMEKFLTESNLKPNLILCSSFYFGAARQTRTVTGKTHLALNQACLPIPT